MNINDYVIPFFTYLQFFPATLLCTCAAKNHLKYKPSIIVLRMGVVSIIAAAILTFLRSTVSTDFRLILLPVLLAVFIVFHGSLTIPLSQSVSLFLLVAAFTNFLSNFSIIYDALLHPDGLLINFSAEAFILQLTLNILFCILASFPMKKYGAFLIDNLQQSNVWWISAMVSAVFFIFNQIMTIHKYNTLHVNRVGSAYISVMSMLFLLLILLCLVFYYIVTALINKAETEDRNRILEMQEKQYDSLQQYIAADRQARHDFRQTIYTLKELSSERDYESIDEYLSSYIEALPKKEVTNYCRDNALNALLNHYAMIASTNDIDMDINIYIEKDLLIDNVDLCSIVGNILENAVLACADVPEEKRFIHVVISLEQGNELYIAISNSFSGKLRQKKDRYLSTHKSGSGIGLISITATAEQYGGSANFSHADGIFYSDVLMINK